MVMIDVISYYKCIYDLILLSLSSLVRYVITFVRASISGYFGLTHDSKKVGIQIF